MAHTNSSIVCSHGSQYSECIIPVIIRDKKIPLISYITMSVKYVLCVYAFICTWCVFISNIKKKNRMNDSKRRVCRYVTMIPLASLFILCKNVYIFFCRKLMRQRAYVLLINYNYILIGNFLENQNSSLATAKFVVIHLHWICFVLSFNNNSADRQVCLWFYSDSVIWYRPRLDIRCDTTMFISYKLD